MEQNYFTEMLSTLATRAGHGTVSWLGFSNTPLRRHLLDIFDREYGDNGSFLADPTFEAVFSWQTAEKTMQELSGNLLHPRLVRAMDQPAADLATDYRFAADRKPYTHQLRSWELLDGEDRNSVVVTSGTGSGKTECFLVPILNQLVQECESVGSLQPGVRALFLYPLNALINSQRDRLQAWTSGINNAAQFCLYNGNTPEKLPVREARIGSEIRDRATLRQEPPPILVTNASMLEYMLVRTQDLPILQMSKGKLEWIILDEAHTYVGSQAAELALLIRRVLHAFGVKSQDVRFVATSATIGGGESTANNSLREFLARVSGNDIARVHVVTGERSIPDLPLTQAPDNTLSLEELSEIDKGLTPTPHRYAYLSANLTARKIRELFTSRPTNPVARLSEIVPLIGTSHKLSSKMQQLSLRWLDLLTSASDQDGTPFLPIRGHLFHQTLAGIWCCADRNCPGRADTKLSDSDWPFGRLWLQHRKHCDCGAPVFELVACEDCGAIYLYAEIKGNEITQPIADSDIDEFALDVDNGESEGEGEQDFNLEPNDRPVALITNRELPNSGDMDVHKETGVVLSHAEADSVCLTAFENDSSDFVCPACEERKHRFQEQFRTACVGVPFYLAGVLPTLLEFASDGDDPKNRTYRGRRLLTFTDSRQGTARLAARLQQDSERTKTRGLIYHNVLAHRSDKSTTVQQLQELEALPNPSAPIQGLIETLQAELRQVSSVGFEKMKELFQLGGLEFEAIRASYAAHSRDLFGSANGSANMAEVLIIREMGRRPKRQNNLETMGLIAVVYPTLEQVSNAPQLWISRGRTADQWKQFLKLALDFFVRGGGSLGINAALRPWIGLPMPHSRIVSSTTEQIGRYQRRWPSVSRSGDRSRLVRLAAALLRADVQTTEGQDVIDAILESAWQNLLSVLQVTPDGYLLPLKELSFRLTREAWVCPFTRRLLDTCIAGLSPYLPRGPLSGTTECEKVSIPLYDTPFGNSALGEDPVRRGQKWLDSNTQVKALRGEGLWSIFHDRIIECAMYFSAAEHSAQLPSTVLQNYEKRFKEGKINILSCSTTMEMGIDIGGVQQVAMNNVPPHPANYLQRAGRAGRRNELRSSALTLCKANPHDQSVFRNSRWAFDTVLPAPVVSLNSRIIVQRHLNALILGEFLRARLVNPQQEIHKLTSGWFFVPTDEPGPAEDFIAWAYAYADGANDGLEKGIKQLTRWTALEAIPASQLLESSAGHLSQVKDSWIAEWNALLEQEAAIDGDSAEPALKAIGFQKKRISTEYLLRELSTNGFLPAYGFPTFVAAFDNLTISGLRNLDSGDENGRGDNRYRRRELASRDLTTALREYAPGAEVVIDGLVYRSAGITLNWHIPASEAESRETQAIKFAWRCGKCGASGTSIVFPKNCDSCGAEISDRERFLEPAGFSVDFYDSPHNNVSSPTFVPVERPWVSARGEWSSLENPNLGKFRTTVEGRVYQRSSGLNGTGYAICLTCGRAEPLTSAGEFPGIFQPGNDHLKLRSKKEDRICPGGHNRWSIIQTVLGHELRTDMIELQLRQTDGQPLRDYAAALTLAVALRDSLAEVIGVQASELGCDARETRNPDGEKCQSIFVFDRFAAGYASNAEKYLGEIFQRAARRLDCPRKCDSSCPNCVLDFDQRFEANILDRRGALRVLSADWLDRMKLPVELQFFGSLSRVETATLTEAIIRESDGAGVRVVRLYTSGRAEDWDFAASTTRDIAYRLLALTRSVEIVIPKCTLNKLADEDRYSLAALADHPKAVIRAADPPPHIEGAFPLAEVQRGNEIIGWACTDSSASLGSARWGTSSGPLIRGIVQRSGSFSAPLTSGSLRPVPADFSDREVSIGNQLDGAIRTFGERFWSALRREHAATDTVIRSQERIVSISYSDRYLFTPLSIALLAQILIGLRLVLGERFGNPEIRVKTMTVRREGQPHLGAKVFSDWPTTQMRDEVAKLVLLSLGKVHFESADFGVQHSREFRVQFASGQLLSLRLDQGVSYWRLAPRSQGGFRAGIFDFASPIASTQVQAVDSFNFAIEGQSVPTQIFAKVRTSDVRR